MDTGRSGTASVSKAILTRQLAACLVILVLTALVTALRRPDKVLWPQFWAEDAIVFYTDAEVIGTASLVRPYAGYLQLAPRLTALAGTQLPVRVLPGLYSACALLAATAVMIAILESGMTRHTPHRAGLCLGVLTAPFTDELWYVATNAQWVLALLLVIACVAPRPSSAGGRAAWLAAVALAGLTGPFALVLLPCAVVRLWWHRDRWSALVLTVWCSCAAVSAATLIEHGRAASIEPVLARAIDVAGHMRLRPALSLVTCAGAAVLAASFVYGLKRDDHTIAVCALAGIVSLAALVFGMPMNVLGSLPKAGGRYLFIPWVATVWTLLLLHDRGVRVAWLPLAGAAALAAAFFVQPPLVKYPWPSDAACLETKRWCHVVVNPAWEMGLPGRGTQ